MTGQEQGSTSIRSKPMTGGDGPYSYSKNSPYQKGIIDASKRMINEAIKEKLDLENQYLDASKTIQIVDFGCSVGPNTFYTVENIIEAIKLKYEDENKLVSSKSLEFQVFFNDHVENDFNTLFKTFPSTHKYFAVGVPGSFHLRLFPKSSIHFAHSSYAVHWLSMIPKEIVDKNSPAYNKESIQCSNFNKEAARAFASQFKKDLNNFLTARAQELVPGGLMVIIKFVLPDGVLMSQSTSGVLYDFFGSCLKDLANLGLINAEKVDTFNLPLYFSNISEVKKLIEENEYFNIERFELLDNPMKKMLTNSEIIVSTLRSTIEGIIKDHFDGVDIDKIFEYFVYKFEKDPPNFKSVSHKATESFILLKRNVNL